MKIRLSLNQTWIALVLFAVIVPVTFLMFWSGQQLYNKQLSSALIIERQSNELLRVQIESELIRLKTLLRNKSDPLSLMLDKTDNQDVLTDINTLLEIIVKREQAVHEAIILSRQSEVIAVIDPDMGAKGDNLLSVEELKKIAAHWEFYSNYESPEVVIPSMGRDYLGSPLKHTNFPKDIFVFSIAIPIGKPAKAVLIALIDVSKFWSASTHHQDTIEEKTHNYMLDRRGSLITTIQGRDYKQGDLMTHLAIARTALIDGEWSPDTSYIGVSNQPVFGTKTYIPSLHWTLISEVIASEITQPIWKSLLQTFSFTLLFLAIFVPFVLFLAKKTILPIQQTCKAINQVAKGDYQFVLKPCGIHELDSMATDFNEMATARKDVENKYRKREEYLNITLNNIADGIITINESGKILSFNKTAETIFGYSADEIIGHKVNQLMPEPFSSEHDDYLLNYIKTGKTHIIGNGREVTGLHKNKKTFPMRLSVVELPKDNLGNRRFIGSCQDLTLGKHQEEQLRRNQKMDALSKIVGGIAHDYNNMLGVITGYTGLLRRCCQDVKDADKFLKQITLATDRGEKLTRKMLNFSRPESSQAESCNINQSLNNLYDMLSKSLTAVIQLQYDLTEEDWLAWIDGGEFEDSILNMAINAKHAMPEGGSLTIATQNKHITEKEAKYLNLEPNDYIKLTLIDTGIGIEESIRDKVFDPFFTTKGEVGNGLGLSQVFGFMDRAGGTINMYTQIGLGTQFSLYFPRYRQQNDEYQKTSKAGVEPQLSGHETILVVDDEPALRELARHILLDAGYKVLTASDGKEALDILPSHTIDLVLSDVIMPNMDGYQMAQQIMQHYPKVKIQLTSGFTGDRHNILKDPQLKEAMLYKPYDDHELLTRIRFLLDGFIMSKKVKNSE